MCVYLFVVHNIGYHRNFPKPLMYNHELENLRNTPKWPLVCICMSVYICIYHNLLNLAQCKMKCYICIYICINTYLYSHQCDLGLEDEAYYDQYICIHPL